MSSAQPRPRASALLLALVACGALLTAVTADASSSPTVSSEPVKRSGNSGYTWWTDPLMARKPGSFYFTGVTANGTQRVYRWGRTKARPKLHLTYTNLRKRPADDHNAPAISMAEGRPSLVFYTGHPGTMFFRRAPTGSNPVLGRKHARAFGNEQRMPFDRPTTYAQVLRDGPRVVVLSRYLGGGQSGWYYVTSQNSGRTWTRPAELFDSESHQAYLMVRPMDTDRSRLHVTAYYHPKHGPENVIGYRTMSMSDFWNGRAERFTIGALEPVWTSDQPALPGLSSLEEPRQEKEEAPAHPTPDVLEIPELPAGPQQQVDPRLPPEIVPPNTRSVRMLDVGDKRGRTMVFGATWDASNNVPVYLQMVRRADGSWSRHTLRSAGGGYGSGNGNYIPGLTLDDRRGVDRVYYGYKSRDRWNLASANLAANGRVGTPTVLRQSDRPLARPVVLGRDLMYQRIDRYTTYRDYFMQVKTFRLR
ncbi:hypothetical protein [Aeromicrobium sp. CTD01-1L150]|uniref:hypothetical protein n=1 Tax=Aeromicrobium sp. CTD01-1L150 TaxID=3341830 RepID=UPI0035C011D6